MKISVRLFFFCFLVSCTSFNEKEISGVYSLVDYKHTFDTIVLFENNQYFRTVYDAHEKLVFKQQGKWELDNDFIRFDQFYLNLDDDLIQFPNLIADSLDSWGGYIIKSNGLIEFCVGHLSATLKNQNCYQKID